MNLIKYTYGSLEIEVFRAETGSVGLIVRDLSIPAPKFNAVTLLDDANYNVIHQDWLPSEAK